MFIIFGYVQSLYDVLMVLTAVGPRKNLAFTSLANMINEGNEEGCPWRAVDEDTGDRSNYIL